jgi:hypothetical protein
MLGTMVIILQALNEATGRKCIMHGGKKNVSGNLDETDELEDQNIVVRIIIKHIFERRGQRCHGCWGPKPVFSSFQVT